MFRISVPVCAPVSHSEPNAAGLFFTPSLSGITIFVIDDDPNVLESMRAVLTGWGANVIAAGSGKEIIALVTEGANRPDIILCDYRLREGENGIEVVRRLQESFREKIPAVLITGDTASDRVGQAHASGLAVLYKPVANSKLRALIGNLLRDGNIADRIFEASGEAITAESYESPRLAAQTVSTFPERLNK